jgi:hypothetical protein
MLMSRHPVFLFIEEITSANTKCRDKGKIVQDGREWETEATGHRGLRHQQRSGEQNGMALYVLNRYTASYSFCYLSSPIRTVPSALELPQVLLLSTGKQLAGYTADQELENPVLLTLPRRQNTI